MRVMFLYWSTNSISKALRKKDPEPSQPRQLKIIKHHFFLNQIPLKKKNHMDKICWIFQICMGDSKWVLWGFCAFLGFWPWNKIESCLTFTSPARFRSPWKELPAFWPSSIIICSSSEHCDEVRRKMALLLRRWSFGSFLWVNFIEVKLFSEELAPKASLLVTFSEMINYIILENTHHIQSSLFCVYWEFFFQTATENFSRTSTNWMLEALSTLNL